MLILSCILIVLIGLIHSYLGERYLLIRLFRRDNLPKLLGSDWFTKQTLRFAWHITSIAWFGFAAMLLSFSLPDRNVPNDILFIISSVFLVSGSVSFIFSKGKHLSWIVFLAISALTYFGVPQV